LAEEGRVLPDYVQREFEGYLISGHDKARGYLFHWLEQRGQRESAQP
jgi:hypothetical protein